MTTLRRREREIVEMRQLIVDAAIQIYKEEGYERLSLRGIANRIEYAVGTIYLYFKDKHELFHAMHEWAFNQLSREFEALQTIQNPMERLQAISRVYIAFAFKNPELYDLMFIMHEPMFANANMEDWPCGKKTYEFLHSTVTKCLEEGHIKGDNPDVLAFMFWSSTHGMLALNMRNRLRMYEGVDIRQLIEHTETMILQQFLTFK
jgi:AcrR family transcriptional regulator